MAHKHTFRGLEVEYDYKAIHKWSVQKALTGAKGPQAMFDGIDEILCGRSDEYAEQLGDEAEAMTELVSELMSLDKDAKN